MCDLVYMDFATTLLDVLRKLVTTKPIVTRPLVDQPSDLLNPFVPYSSSIKEFYLFNKRDVDHEDGVTQLTKAFSRSA